MSGELEEIEDKNIVKSLELVESGDIGDDSLSDTSLVARRPFSSLTADEKPLIPLPDDPCPDIYYPASVVETKCHICMSPWRTRVEHEFIDKGQKPHRVCTFFKKYFGVTISFGAVATHMAQHCDLSRLSQDGALYYKHREEDLSVWKGREDDLTLMALTDQLFNVRGMSCKTMESQFRRASTIAQLSKQILQIKKDRDEGGASNINFFKVLMDIHDRLQCDPDKKIVREIVRELRETLTAEPRNE